MRISPFALAAFALLAAPAAAQTAPAPSLREIADQVDEARLRATIEHLVGFGTRNTLSVRDDPHRGIGAALNWAEGEFRSISGGCGGCLEIVRPHDTVTGSRIPTLTLIEDVVAIQRGTSDPERVVIITGHIDSRASDVMDATTDAPGANDDGSGVAALIEAARILSRYRFPATIVYAALSGEEQGLHGGRVLAEYARDRGWRVEADLNNDIIGSSCGSDGTCDDNHVRVFSEGPRWQGHEALAPQIRSRGGENDSPSRNLSRFLDTLADELALGLDVRQIWRNDRFGRGGDHSEFLNLGFPAVRMTVAVENYNQQHQNVRTEDGVRFGDTIDVMDFPYLRRVTQLNVAALAALARAPAPPAPTVEGAVSTDTTLSWPRVPGAMTYFLRWRPTDAAQWQEGRRVTGGFCPVTTIIGSTRPGPDHGCRVVLPHIRVDDWVFGVSSVAADGSESPVASAVPGGAFEPYEPPAPSPEGR